MKVLVENSIIQQLGARIRYFRKNQKITQNQLAFEAGIPRVQIGRIERGEVNTTIKSLVAIANALGVHPRDFFDIDLPTSEV